jgi:hypothetical protein
MLTCVPFFKRVILFRRAFRCDDLYQLMTRPGISPSGVKFLYSAGKNIMPYLFFEGKAKQSSVSKRWRAGGEA